ncbi:MAG: hypothetical protein ACFFAU_03105 [Candidatus Hodarchaeota archaeon]
MSINGSIMKYGIIAIIIGGIIATSAFIIAFQLVNDGGGNGNNEPPIIGGIGARIATRMAEAEENIVYIWMSNNTFVNNNLTEHYGKYIDGVNVGLINETPNMALIHEPEAELANINQEDLNNVMSNFRGAITVLNETSDIIMNTTQIWPPTFLCDIAYEDGTSLSIWFSKEHNVISILNGTWQLSPFDLHGITALIFDYSLDDLVFLPVSDIQLILTAIQSVENLIYETFPT